MDEIDDALFEQRLDDLSHRLKRIEESNRFIELALIEFLKKKPGLVEELRLRAKETSDPNLDVEDVPSASRGSNRAHKAKPPLGIEHLDPRFMNEAEKKAWKRALARELTGQNKKPDPGPEPEEHRIARLKLLEDTPSK